MFVLDPATPTPCPFNDAYYFRYSDHVTGSCDQPISYAKPCVGHTKYLLHFKQCATQDLVVLDRGRGQITFDMLPKIYTFTMRVEGYRGGSPTAVQVWRPCPLWEPSPIVTPY